jgi:hypothetical protein
LFPWLRECAWASEATSHESLVGIILRFRLVFKKNQLMTENAHQLFFVAALRQLVVEPLKVGIAHVGEYFRCELRIRSRAAGL